MEYTDDGVLIIIIECGVVVIQSILDLLYYGWRDGITIDVDTCKQIINICDFLNVGDNLVKDIMMRLLNPNLYKHENLGDVYDTIATGYPAILRTERFLAYKQHFTKNIFSMVLDKAKKDLEPYKLIVGVLAADLSSDELHAIFMENHILFDTLLRSKKDKLLEPIIKKLTHRDDIIYVYDTMIEALKSNGCIRSANLFEALAAKINYREYPSMSCICTNLSKY
jgi:hypothetical protein